MDYKKLTDTFVNSTSSAEKESALDTLVKEMNNGNLNVVQFVQLMEEHLTTTKEEPRKAATALFGEVLDRSEAKLNEETVSFLSQFFCARSQDRPCLGEVLRGLLSLVKRHHLPPNEPTAVSRTLFNEVYVQALTQPQRSTVFQILKLLLTDEAYLKELKEMSNDVVFGFIQSLEGEKDPRVLLLAFQIIPIITKQFSLGRFAEDLFEVFACYFPITFTPKANDPNAVSPQHLTIGLRISLVSSSQFLPFCIPLLIDKLTSTILNTKLESLQVLKLVLKTFSIEELSSHVSALWTTLRTEILSTKDKPVLDDSLACVQALVLNASKNEAALSNLLQQILTQTKPELLTSDPKTAELSAMIITASATASAASASIILNSIISELLSNFKDSQTIQNGDATSAVLADLIRVSVLFWPEATTNPIQPQLASILDVFSKSLDLNNPAVKRNSITGIGSLLNGKLVSSDIASSLLQRITALTLDKSFGATALDSLIELTPNFSQLISQNSVEFLFSNLSKQFKTLTIDNPLYLTLVRLSTIPQLTNVMIDKLLMLIRMHFMETVFVLNGSGCLFQLLDEIISKLLPNSHPSFQKISSFLFDGFVGASEAPQQFDPQVIQLSAQIMLHIAQSMTAGDQLNMLQFMIQMAEASSMFSIQSSLAKQQARIFLLVVIISLKASTMSSLVNISFGLNGDPLLKSLISIFTRFILNEKIHPTPQNPLFGINHITCVALASLLNKLEHSSPMIKFAVDSLLNVNDTAATDTQRYEALIWISKAFLAKGENANSILDYLFEQLKQTAPISRSIAFLFESLLTDDEFFSKKSDCTIKNLYKQKAFQTLLPRLTNSFTSNSDLNVKNNHLICLTLLAKNVSKGVLKPSLPQLLPMLIQSLSSSITDSETKQSILNLLNSLMSDSQMEFVDHLSHLIPVILELSYKDSKVDTRISALNCLQTLASFPFPKTYPFRNLVINDLKFALDDSKRIVRKTAVLARNLWVLAGEEK